MTTLRASKPAAPAILVGNDDAFDSDIPLEDLGPPTPSTTTSSAPPAYSFTSASPSGGPLVAAADFRPTVHLQIETPGKPLFSFPIPTRPDPIPVFELSGGDGYGPDAVVDARAAPLFLSLRATRGSGNCTLVRGDDPDRTPLCTTTYRWGPGRSPVVQLVRGHLDGASPLALDASPSSSSSLSVGDTLGEHAPGGPSFEINAVSPLLSRAQKLKTPHGEFAWRYAGRKERAALSARNPTAAPVSSLLVCERVLPVALAGGRRSDATDQRTRVAHFVRSADLRTPGTRGSTAGNGGRLLVDLRLWADGKRGERDDVLQIVVASCITMLKKEVDRRRAQQIMVMSAGASGGP